MNKQKFLQINTKPDRNSLVYAMKTKGKNMVCWAASALVLLPLLCCSFVLYFHFLLVTFTCYTMF